MKHKFSRVPQAEIPRSSFDRSHGYKTTFDAGYLVPIYVDEALPGDTFNLKMTGFARMATPIKPVMDNLYMETFFFAVPNRLLWEHWENFMGEKETIDDSTEYQVPEIVLPENSETAGSIYDYMGIPIYANNSVKFNTLHFRAYNLIWNEWFRDQNLQNPVRVNLADTGDIPEDFEVLRRGKRHDYFTSCLPWPQKGEDVLIPGTIQGGDYAVSGVPGTGGAVIWQNLDDEATGGIFGAANDVNYGVNPDITVGDSMFYGPQTGLEVTIPSADFNPGDAGGWATINDLRVAFQLQKMLERDARGGTRYTEVIRAHFGVTSPDARLQRPEFLGGGSSRVTVKPVEQNTQTGDDTTPQGNLAAFATAQLHNHGFVKSFTEHCTIIGLVNVRADLTYQQGLNRMWFRRGRYDYFWPVFANVSEQQVFDWEIYAEDESGDPNGVIFGYQERYAEYRYKPSQITGKFRSDDPESLDIWHLSQDFGSSPTLNDEFIIDEPPIDRVVATPEEPHFLFDSYFNLRCARPMPLFGVPGNIDRF